jgi:chemotaxis protein methyltransferase CheR
MLDAETRKRYFIPAERGVVVGDALRSLVEFRRHNLATDPAPTAAGRPFELISCRNVLIYFEPDVVEHVIASLEGGLAPHGTLILGAADRLFGSARKLARLEELPAAAPRRLAPTEPLRRPLGRDHAEPRGGLAEALTAANDGGLDVALAVTERLLDQDPLDGGAQFIRGLAQLSGGDANAAVASLRRTLYIDPDFGLAAFTLGRAHEELGDPGAAARAYEQALRTLEPKDARYGPILEQVDLADVAAACVLRVEALRAVTR